MTLYEITLWWFTTFIPFMPIPMDLQCTKTKCKFTIMEDGYRTTLVWDEDRILNEIQDDVKTCQKERVVF